MKDYCSKYKNPDKYIARLKQENKEAWGQVRRADARMGDCLHWRGAGVWADSRALSGLGYDRFRVGDTVMHVGTITRVVVNREQGRDRSEIFFDLAETRRIPR